MFDLIIIGAGLTGLVAANFAARRGAKVLLLAQGWGLLSHSSGVIDCHGWQAGQPCAAPNWQSLLTQHSPAHPYQHSGSHLAAAFTELQQICQTQNYPLLGDLQRNFWLPNAFGGIRPAVGVPASMVAADRNTPNTAAPFTLASIAGFLDGQTALARPTAHTAWLQLPAPSTQQHTWHALNWAQHLDNPFERERVLKQWRTAINEYRQQSGQAATLLGLPAVLGYTAWADVLHAAEDALEAHIFELPTLPPSVPGLRLQRALAAALATHGGQLVLGCRVSGQCQQSVATLQVHGLGKRSQTYHTGTPVLLASGGFSAGGLFAPTFGQVYESCFGLPVPAPDGTWAAQNYLAAQPYAQLGLTVNERGQPCDAAGSPFARNLWAAGAVLGGAQRAAEGSRAGIAIASAYTAVQSILR